eukprot:4621848-Pyramimonas_sp.AAC.1
MGRVEKVSNMTTDPPASTSTQLQRYSMRPFKKQTIHTVMWSLRWQALHEALNESQDVRVPLSQ